LRTFVNYELLSFIKPALVLLTNFSLSLVEEIPAKTILTRFKVVPLSFLSSFTPPPPPSVPQKIEAF
jgi:hypothetical protein